jgi:hypothetical protein
MTIEILQVLMDAKQPAAKPSLFSPDLLVIAGIRRARSRIEIC